MDGRTHSLHDYEGMPVAVVFSCCHCPYVVAWEDRIDAIARDFEGRAGLVAVNSNHHAGDSFESMVTHWRDKGFSYPFLRDESQEVAHAYAAARTPEVFLFDREHRLAYHGAPDSDHQHERKATPYLRDAIEAVLRGEAPPVAQTPAVGCTVKYRD